VTTLLDYARTEFPHHMVEIWRDDNGAAVAHPRDVRPSGLGTAPSKGPNGTRVGDRPTHSARHRSPSKSGRSSAAADASLASLRLVDRTVVAHVIGADAAVEMLRLLRAAGWSRSAAVLVRPAAPRVVGRGQEDPQSVTDLPDRRVAAAAGLGAVIGATALALIGIAVGDEAAATVVVGAFGAILGATAGAMMGGLGRHAGERAWAQPHAPGRPIGVVAVFAEDERDVAESVDLMERADPHTVRVVNARGDWRAPLT
jgi:hypothetical protein